MKPLACSGARWPRSRWPRPASSWFAPFWRIFSVHVSSGLRALEIYSGCLIAGRAERRQLEASQQLEDIRRSLCSELTGNEKMGFWDIQLLLRSWCKKATPKLLVQGWHFFTLHQMFDLGYDPSYTLQCFNFISLTYYDVMTYFRKNNPPSFSLQSVRTVHEPVLVVHSEDAAIVSLVFWYALSSIKGERSACTVSVYITVRKQFIIILRSALLPLILLTEGWCCHYVKGKWGPLRNAINHWDWHDLQYRYMWYIRYHTVSSYMVLCGWEVCRWRNLTQSKMFTKDENVWIIRPGAR